MFADQMRQDLNDKDYAIIIVNDMTILQNEGEFPPARVLSKYMNSKTLDTMIRLGYQCYAPRVNEDFWEVYW